jgi:hypothetical protein
VSSTATSIEVKWTPAYDDGGSPIAKYLLEIDEVEGIDTPNVENWVSKFAGEALTYTVISDSNSNLVTKAQYRFRVSAISEYNDMQSLYSEISTYYCAALPEKIEFPTTTFVDFGANTLEFVWNQPTMNLAEMLLIDSYRVYWDAGYLLQG